MKSNLVDIACFVRMETSRAVLINDGHREVWLPKSQVEVDEAGSTNGELCATVTMPFWLAKSKELI